MADDYLDLGDDMDIDGDLFGDDPIGDDMDIDPGDSLDDYMGSLDSDDDMDGVLSSDGFDDSLDDDIDDIDFDDDDDDGEPKERKKLSKGAIAGIVIAVIVAVLIAAGAIFTATNKDGGAPQDTNQAQQRQGGDAASAGKVVVRETTGVTYEGADNALNTNGTGAILAFDYAYYSLRSGEEAIKFFDPDNKEYTAENIQTEINKMHPSTRYSLQITPIVIGKTYEVTLTLYIPSGNDIARFSYQQKFDMVEKNGKYYVKQFSSTLVK